MSHMQTQIKTVQVEVKQVEVPIWIAAAIGLAILGLLTLILLAFQFRKRGK